MAGKKEGKMKRRKERRKKRKKEGRKEGRGVFFHQQKFPFSFPFLFDDSEDH
jgi:hypothetical protein